MTPRAGNPVLSNHGNFPEAVLKILAKKRAQAVARGRYQETMSADCQILPPAAESDED